MLTPLIIIMIHNICKAPNSLGNQTLKAQLVQKMKYMINIYKSAIKKGTDIKSNGNQLWDKLIQIFLKNITASLLSTTPQNVVNYREWPSTGIKAQINFN